MGEAAAVENVFLARLHRGQPTFMLGIRGARTTDVIRIAASTGHQAVLIDLEHSAMPIEVATSLSATAGDLGLTALVRVPEREYGVIGRLLDGGAHGIVVPRVETADQARLASEACHFPPRGHRSQLASVPHSQMAPTPARVLNPLLDALTVLQILVETPAGVSAARSIAAVDGVDMLAVGANDLTAELGVPGDYRHRLLREAVAEIADACREHGKLMMLGGVGDPEAFGELASLGACPLVLTGMDNELLHASAKARVAALTESFDPWPALLEEHT